MLFQKSKSKSDDSDKTMIVEGPTFSMFSSPPHRPFLPHFFTRGEEILIRQHEAWLLPMERRHGLLVGLLRPELHPRSAVGSLVLQRNQANGL
jgi:hypothetical protein